MIMYAISVLKIKPLHFGSKEESFFLRAPSIL